MGNTNTNEKNALAELAECIKNADIQIGKMAGCSFECIRKAQCIVTELAKVKVEAIKENPSMVGDAFINLMAECRAVAEEGANNGFNIHGN